MIGSTANGALKVIREIGLEYAHAAPLVIRHYVRRQLALLAPVYPVNVVLRGTALKIPSVDVGLSLPPEEYGTAVVRTEEDKFSALRSDVRDLAVSQTVLQVGSLDGEEVRAAEVGEDQVAAAIGAADEGEGEDIATRATKSYGLGQDDAVATAGGHVEHEDGAISRIGDVDEHVTVARVVRNDVLEARAGRR